MKIILVKPPFLDAYPMLLGPGIYASINDNPPLNLLYLAAPLEQQGKHDVEVLDANIMGYSMKRTAVVILEKKPDLIGIMAYQPLLAEAKLLAQEIRKTDKSIHIVVGGPQVDLYPEQILSWDEIDTVTLKDAEYVFSELVDAIANKKPLNAISGLGYKEEGKLIFTSEGSLCLDLDKLPFPNRKLIPYKKYHTFLCDAPYSTVLITSRGCPFQCKFCANSQRRDRNVHYRSVTNVVDEVEEILALDIRKIFFYDDSFCFSRNRVLEVCDEIIKRKLKKFTFSIKARVNPLDDEMLIRLKEAGCTTVGFGFETANSETLERMKKMITVEDCKRALQLCKKHNIFTMGYFVLGYPGETYNQALKTIDFAINSPLDYAQFFAYTPLPGTETYWQAVQKGIFGDFWADFSKDPINHDYFPDWDEPISRKEKKALVKHAHNKFFFNPRKMLKIYRTFNTLLRRKRLAKTAFKFLTGRFQKF